MVATVLLMPGGLVLLLSIALLVLLARTPRGQRALVGLKRRVPPRLRAQIKRVLTLMRGEKNFLLPPTAVRSPENAGSPAVCAVLEPTNEAGA